jgi:hypothetical protein
MRRVLVTIALFLMVFISVAQQKEKVTVEPTDTIVLISGRKVVASVQGVTTSKIMLIPYEGKVVKEMDRKQVHKILYRNGRVESFNSLAVVMVDEDSWQTVIVTDNQDDAEGMFALGEVSAQSSPQARNARAAKKSADIRLKKRAVNMGGIVVLVSKRESKGGYGEIPTHFVEGVVYGFEPPLE